MTTDEQAPEPDARFLTLKDAAAILNVNPSTLSRQCAAGTFPHVRIGRTVRIPRAEVDRLERGEQQRTSVLEVPDYVTDTPSMFDAPEADSPEDDADMIRRAVVTRCQWGPACEGVATETIAEGAHEYAACSECLADVVSGDAR